MRPLPIEQDGQPEWEVERIEGERIVGRKKIKEYLVKWIGYGDDERTWEPVEHLENAQSVLRDWIIRHSRYTAKQSQPRSPRRQRKSAASAPVDKINLLFYTSPIEKLSICCECNADFGSRNQLFAYLHVMNECLK